MKKCIISLGINGKSPKDHPPKIWQDFPRGIKRIRERLKEVRFDGDFIGWDKEYPLGAPSFTQAHGAAKPFCFMEAYKQGFELILWVDSAAYFKRSPKPLFDIIKKRGYLIVTESEKVGEYCSDAVLGTLNITREEAFSIQSCWSAIVGLDLSKNESRDLLFKWHEKSMDGITFSGAKWSGVKGYPATVSVDSRVKGHRYDQTALSVLAYQLGLTNWMSFREIGKYILVEREYVRKYDEGRGVAEGEK